MLSAHYRNATWWYKVRGHDILAGVDVDYPCGLLYRRSAAAVLTCRRTNRRNQTDDSSQPPSSRSVFRNFWAGSAWPLGMRQPCCREDWRARDVQADHAQPDRNVLGETDSAWRIICAGGFIERARRVCVCEMHLPAPHAYQNYFLDQDTREIFLVLPHSSNSILYARPWSTCTAGLTYISSVPSTRFPVSFGPPRASLSLSCHFACMRQVSSRSNSHQVLLAVDPYSKLV